MRCLTERASSRSVVLSITAATERFSCANGTTTLLLL